MIILFVILIILASVALGLIVLVQNPKGGGLAGNIAGFSTQFMGVKQTNDVLEKGTWISAAIVGVLCLLSVLFLGGSGTVSSSDAEKVGNTAPAQTQEQPQNPLQQNNTTTPVDTNN